MSFGERLKQVRNSTGLTQEAFAEAIGVSRNPINAAEKDRSRLQPLTIRRICEIYEINEEWLSEGIGEMQKQPYNLPADEIKMLLAGYDKLPLAAREHFLAFLDSLSGKEGSL